MDDEKVALVDMDGTLADFRGALDRDVARVLNGRGEDVKVHTAQGFFIRLRFKFDEDLFRGADTVVNRSLDRPAS